MRSQNIRLERSTLNSWSESIQMGLSTFNVNIETSVRVCQLQVRADEVVIPPWYRVKGNQAVQQFSVREHAEYGDAHFRVRLAASSVFRRVDVRFLQGSWATLIVHKDQLMKVGLNGSRESNILLSACNEIMHQVKARPTTIDVQQLGLSVRLPMKRMDDDNRSVRSVSTLAGQTTSTTRPTTPSTPSELDDVMPSSMITDRAAGIQDEAIKKLEGVLALIKVPTFDQKPESTD